MILNKIRGTWSAGIFMVGPRGSGRRTTLEQLDRRTRHLAPPPTLINLIDGILRKRIEAHLGDGPGAPRLGPSS